MNLQTQLNPQQDHQWSHLITRREWPWLITQQLQLDPQQPLLNHQSPQLDSQCPFYHPQYNHSSNPRTWGKDPTPQKKDLQQHPQFLLKKTKVWKEAVLLPLQCG
ncbi:hypothetical protein R3I94_000872 [Phoxinus phoxinus]